MKEKLEDQISAFLDEELPDEECQLLVRRLTRDDQLRATFGRYALVGAILRKESGIHLQPELLSRVSDAIAGEEAHELSLPGAGLSRRWLRPVAGAAVAAAVAVLALFSLKPTPVDEGRLAENSEPLEEPVIVLTPDEVRPVSAPARFTNYLVNHSDYSGSLRQLTHIVMSEENEGDMEVEDE